MRLQGRRLLLVVNDAEAFFPSRDAVARAARHAGMEVHVAAPPGPGAARLAAAWPFISVPLHRRGMNPVSEARTVLTLRRAIRGLQPDLVHGIALKGAAYGGLAARLARTPTFVATLTGLGFAFTGSGGGARWGRLGAVAALRAALRHPRCHAMFQNAADRDELVRRRVVDAARTSLVAGSGIDLEAFPQQPEPAGAFRAVLPARMIADKGIAEFVAAARILRARLPEARLELVGPLDPGNPAAVPLRTLEAWKAEDVVDWEGPARDMREVYGRAHAVCLPSYREGIPRVLLEAAASGRATLACDVPGCRDVVEDGVTGLLVPPHDAAALAAALERLARDPTLRRSLAKAARGRVADQFTLDRVVQDTLAVYERLLAPEGGA